MKSTDIELGMTVRDKLTGWVGKAVMRTFNVTGLERISILEPMKDGKMGKEYSFDINQIEILDKTQDFKPTPPPAEKFKFREKVKDTITGYTGRVVARAVHFNGCVKLGVQGEVTKEGKVPDVEYFEEPLIISIEPVETKKKLTDSKETRRTGGPGRSEPPRSF